jgi:flagellar motor switch protein FliN
MTDAPLPQESPIPEETDAAHIRAVPDPPETHVSQTPIGAAPTPIRPDASTSPKIAILGDVELRVDVVLGRARQTLQELLGIRPGQTIELDRQRNSPVEVLVNNKPFALGEIVVIDETNLGVRVLEILDWAAGTTTRAS